MDLSKLARITDSGVKATKGKKLRKRVKDSAEGFYTEEVQFDVLEEMGFDPDDWGVISGNDYRNTIILAEKDGQIGYLEEATSGNPYDGFYFKEELVELDKEGELDYLLEDEDQTLEDLLNSISWVDIKKGQYAWLDAETQQIDVYSKEALEARISKRAEDLDLEEIEDSVQRKKKKFKS